MLYVHKSHFIALFCVCVFRFFTTVISNVNVQMLVAEFMTFAEKMRRLE